MKFQGNLTHEVVLGLTKDLKFRVLSKKNKPSTDLPLFSLFSSIVLLCSCRRQTPFEKGSWMVILTFSCILLAAVYAVSDCAARATCPAGMPIVVSAFRHLCGQKGSPGRWIQRLEENIQSNAIEIWITAVELYMSHLRFSRSIFRCTV